MVPPATIDNLVGGYGEKNRYLNREVIDDYVDRGVSLKDVLKAYRRGQIDFGYQRRFDESIRILRDKESHCDVVVSEFIEKNVHERRLFFTQNHPTTALFVHCVNQILKLLGETYEFNADDFSENVGGFSKGWPHGSADRRHWNFRFKVKRKSDAFYRKHIKAIYLNRLTEYAYPLSYSIPNECFADGEVTKTKLFADIIPGKQDTYVYDNQADYYRGYQEALFGYTYCKGGWDCLRHYEIIANRCIPYFLNLDACPVDGLSTFPKELVLRAMRELDEGVLSLAKYQQYLEQLMSHARQRMTCQSAARYFLSTMEQRSAHRIGVGPKVLMINVGSVNYSRETLSIGLRQVLGADFVDFPRNEKLYDGTDFTYPGVVSDEGIDRSCVKQRIARKEFDYVVIASVDHASKLKLSKIPFWRAINKHYDMRQIAFVFGGDQSPYIGASSSAVGDTLQEYLQWGVCFVRESYDSHAGLSTADWPTFVELRKQQWEALMGDFPRKNTDQVDWLPADC